MVLQASYQSGQEDRDANCGKCKKYIIILHGKLSVSPQANGNSFIIENVHI